MLFYFKVEFEYASLNLQYGNAAFAFKRVGAEDRVVFMRSTLPARWQIICLMLQPEGKTSHFMKLPISLSVVCRSEFFRWLITIIMQFCIQRFAISLDFFLSLSLFLLLRLLAQPWTNKILWLNKNWKRQYNGGDAKKHQLTTKIWGNNYRNQMMTALACYNYTKAFGFLGGSSPLPRTEYLYSGITAKKTARTSENVERMPEAYGKESTRGK